VKRREFITLLGGAAAWPLAARAQQPEGMRRIGVLVGLAEDDPETKARLAAFRQGLEKRGWSEGRNVRIDARFAPVGTQAQVLAKELVALQPDVIFAHSTPRRVAAREPHDADRVRRRRRPDWLRLRCKPAAAGRQYHGRDAVRSHRHRQVARDAQGDCARP
jgi:hypothetical protein